MTTASLIIKSFAELAVIILLIAGFVNESKLVRFERKAAKIIKYLVNERRSKRQLEEQKELVRQKHAVEYEAEHKSAPVPTSAARRAQRPRRVA